MNIKAKFLVLSGLGINCENESKQALEIANINSDIVHIYELIERPKLLLDYQGLFLPGGFSFGDDLGSGKVLGIKMKMFLKEIMLEFLNLKKPIIGICNGFQVLLALGILPKTTMEKNMLL